VPITLRVPAATTVGVNQQPQGGGSDQSGDPEWKSRWPKPVTITTDNFTRKELLVHVRMERETLRDRLRITIRDV
jgi:hypothetical protein